MSNEYKDWLNDNQQEAKKLIEKYPFLQIKNNDIYTWLEVGGYEETWLDDLPDGWKIGFCEQMCDELMEALGDYADKWIILQVKEKYGELRIYYSILPKGIYDAVEAVISKYEKISRHTCCICGNPATKTSKGWVLPFCDECYGRRK